jgi:hypothetical protein
MEMFELRTESLYSTDNRSKVNHQDLVKHYTIFQSYFVNMKNVILLLFVFVLRDDAETL